MYHLPTLLLQIIVTERLTAIAIPTRILPDVPSVTAPSTGIRMIIILLLIRGELIVLIVVDPVM